MKAPTNLLADVRAYAAVLIVLAACGPVTVTPTDSAVAHAAQVKVADSQVVVSVWEDSVVTCRVASGWEEDNGRSVAIWCVTKSELAQ